MIDALTRSCAILAAATPRRYSARRLREARPITHPEACLQSRHRHMTSLKTMSLKIFINGRFLSQSLTGVQRYAAEMVKAIDRMLASGEAPRPLREAEWQLLAPPNATAAIDLAYIKTRKVGRRTGHAWDQIDLARAAWGGRLISLANSGPVAHRNQLVVIHDAQVFRRPDFFSRQLSDRCIAHSAICWPVVPRSPPSRIFRGGNLPTPCGCRPRQFRCFPTARNISRQPFPTSA